MRTRRAAPLPRLAPAQMPPARQGHAVGPQPGVPPLPGAGGTLSGNLGILGAPLFLGWGSPRGGGGDPPPLPSFPLGDPTREPKGSAGVPEAGAPKFTPE